MSAEDDGTTLRHIAQLLYKNDSALFKAPDNMLVMHNRMPNVKWRSMSPNRQIDNFNGVGNSGTKAPWGCEKDAFQQFTFYAKEKSQTLVGSG
jgi:hypothetical protein